MTFTKFWDMHSGGSTKEKPFEQIYIEATEVEAKLIFYNKFKHNPERVTCTCCGEDYSIYESDSLELATAYHRLCDWSKVANDYDPATGKVTIEEYCKRPDVLVIRANEIEASERSGEVPV